MDFFYSKDKIERLLTDAFIYRYRQVRNRDVALTGILLARPEDEITRDKILPHLEFWHHRSDCHTDFFCAGYIPMEIAPLEGVKDARPVNVSIRDMTWGFSITAFVDLLEFIEEETSWHDNGDPCLLLANAYFDGQRAHLDFKRSIRINFREASKDEAIGTPTGLVSQVFEFAKRVNEDSTDPVWEFSDELGVKLIKRGLKETFIGWMPDSLKSSARAGFHFAIHEN